MLAGGLGKDKEREGEMRWALTKKTVIIIDAFLCCDSFLMISNRRWCNCLLAIKREGRTINWNHEPFDFSSRTGWDNFYKKGNQSESLEELEYEWHSHIAHSVIVDAISPTISNAASRYAQINDAAAKNKLPSILLIGTGNSALPRVLHDAFDTPVRVTCLDYSPVCIEMIRSMYSDLCPNMDFILGDATRLQHAVNNTKYDVIVDKGLLDALMCGEGFDSDLEKLMAGIDGVLTCQEWGISVLICFQLSSASKQSLVELVDRGKSSAPALFWDFDVPVEGSEIGKTTLNLARRSALHENRIT